MGGRVWNNGPPPHVGWWNASIDMDRDVWRWWDGTHWSIAARPYLSAEEAERCARCRNHASWDIQWTGYYPSDARVPRVAP